MSRCKVTHSVMQQDVANKDECIMVMNGAHLLHNMLKKEKAGVCEVLGLAYPIRFLLLKTSFSPSVLDRSAAED